MDHLRCRRGGRRVLGPAALPAPRIPAAGGADLPAVPDTDRPRRFAAPRRAGGHRVLRPQEAVLLLRTHRKHNGLRRARKPLRGRSAGPCRPAASAARSGGRSCSSRWQARLAEVTELSLAYHDAAAAPPDDCGDGAGQRKAQATAPPHGHGPPEARGRRGRAGPAVAAGTFGHCEQCGSAIPATLLTLVPEALYRLRRADGPDEPAPTRRPAVAGRGPSRDDGTHLGLGRDVRGLRRAPAGGPGPDQERRRLADGRAGQRAVDRRRAGLRRRPVAVAGPGHGRSVRRRLPAGKGPQRGQHVRVRHAVRLAPGAGRAPAAGAAPRGGRRARTPRRLHRGRRGAHRARRLDLLRVRRAGGAGGRADVPLRGPWRRRRG